MISKEVSSKFILLFVITNQFYVTHGACKLHDASWEGSKGPTISQPSKTEPTRVKIDWGNVIKNARCVDEYSLLLWKKGTAKTDAVRVPISNKGSVSFITEVEACVEYNFVVEFVENDFLAKDIKESVSSSFKTEAVPQLKSREKNLFKIGYYFDKVTKINNLSKVVIRFPKNILENANCIKHLEITGQLSSNSGNLPSPTVKKIRTTQAKEEANLLYPDHNHHRVQDNLPRTKRNIFGFGSTSSTSPSPATISSTSTQTTVAPPIVRADNPNGELAVLVTPPFLNDIIEAAVDGVVPCKSYSFKVKLIGPQGSTLGEISGLELPILTEILDFHPPPIAKLLQIDLSSANPAIQLQQGFGVPLSCMPILLESVDRQIERLEEDVMFHVDQEINSYKRANYLNQELNKALSSNLKLLGCKCPSTVVNLTSTDLSIVQRFQNAFGLYYYDGIHQGKPFYRSQPRHSIIDLKTSSLTRIKRDALCSSFATEQNIESFGRPIQKNLVKRSISNSPETSSLIASAIASTANTTANILVSGRSPESLEVRANPEEVQRPNQKEFFLYWDAPDKTWVISDQLGTGKQILKSQKNSRATCPADPENAKSWTYSATIQWKNDPTLKVECLN